MENRVARGVMPTSVPGSKRAAAGRPEAGFTLLELLIVITVIALSTGLSVVALRDSSRAHLEQEATRLAALLDAARVESRVTGRMVTWRPLGPGAMVGAQPGGWAPKPAGPSTGQAPPTVTAEGRDFLFEPPMGEKGVADDAWPTRWLHEGTVAEIQGAPRVVLGPEPLIPPQRIRLRLNDQQLLLVTDGLGGFQVESLR